MTANRIIQHIFQQPDIKQVEERALEQLVSTYPYFTAARLLLARKQYSTQRNLLAPAVKKAQQYSTNMHYFYRFVTTEEKIVPPVAATPEVVPPVLQEEIIATPAQEPAVQPVVAQEPVTVIHTSVPKAPEPAPVMEVTPVVPASIPANNIEAPLTVIANEIAEEKTIVAIPPPAVKETPATITPVTAAPVDSETDPIKIFPLAMPEAETSLTFQPLYTDDYFAYKRIKEPEHAEMLNDKGAAEMKSFTSWLKDMKHTFAEKASKQWYHQQMHRSYEDVDPEVSATVEKMAMSSITLNDDIVSETLAEIWARQHQYQTAILIYQKLSLLNPNKSAYFAQKIKELQLLTDKN
jgi:hypothetical protein